MEAGRDPERSRRRLSSSSEERMLFYIGDLSADRRRQELASPGSDGSGQQQQQQSSPRPRSAGRRNSSAQTGLAGGNRARRQRRPSEFAEGSVRRSSAGGQQHRSRANSCSRPTPLGDGRRASVCNKRKSVSSAGRRASTACAVAGRRPSNQRRDSAARPDGPRSSSVLLAPAGLEALKDPQEVARARRHRLVALVLLATFAFILLAAVLAVVITLTHSSFHVPPIGSRELAEHRANVTK